MIPKFQFHESRNVGRTASCYITGPLPCTERRIISGTISAQNRASHAHPVRDLPMYLMPGVTPNASFDPRQDESCCRFDSAISRSSTRCSVSSVCHTQMTLHRVTTSVSCSTGVGPAQVPISLIRWSPELRQYTNSDGCVSTRDAPKGFVLHSRLVLARNGSR